MLGLAACVGLILSVAGTVQAPVGAGNALTLPAQRHLVRIDPHDGGPAIWMLALQQDSIDGHGLGFFRSDDSARSFHYVAPIQNDWTERDEADMVTVGSDIALVYSYEGPTLTGSTRKDVYFQWWRYQPATRTFAASPPLRIFDSTSDSTAYSRAEIAIDSTGRIWVQAFKMESDGSSTAEIAVSHDDGQSFQILDPLDHLPRRGGGRLLALGDEMIFVYAMHTYPGDQTFPSHFRLHADSAADDDWGPVQEAFPEGIYHGAALSAVATGDDGMDLVYKNELNEYLYYRHFDGTRFGPATLLDSANDWALQPAITRVGNDVYIFYNHRYSLNTNYDFRYRRLHDGTIGAPVVLDSTVNFKGYPAAAAVLPTSVSDIPAFFGETPDADSSGNLVEVFAPDVTSPPPPPPDAGTGDAGTSDGGTGGGGGTPQLLFSDDFSRSGGDSDALGNEWTTIGLWYADQEAISDLSSSDDLALANTPCFGDCEVQAKVLAFGVPAAVVLRAGTGSGNPDRYPLELMDNRDIQIQRIRNGITTVLAEVPSGIPDAWTWGTLSLSATGTGPVTLTASVDGVPKATAVDNSDQAISDEGGAGLYTRTAGVDFDAFRLYALGTTEPPDAGTPDAGSPDAGQPDSGTPDAGTPDAGTPDAGTPDAGLPDGGSDAGTPDAGQPVGVLFADSFSRSGTDDDALGSNWRITGLWYADQEAVSDLDGTDFATETAASCADCSVQARVIAFGVPAAIFARQPAGSHDRYQLQLLANQNIQIQRIRDGITTVLAEVPSGIPDQWTWGTLKLSVTGSGPVTLTASVNGEEKTSVVDSGGQALTGPGEAGLFTEVAGVDFDDFELDGIGTSSGGADAGTGGGGVTDAGTPDGGSDSGTEDAGTPDAGAPDAGQPDGGEATGVLFDDAFTRSGSDGDALGGNWRTTGLWYADDEAVSDLDGTDFATETVATCADCSAQARVIAFGVPAAVFLRQPTGSHDRYQLQLLANRDIQIQRIRNGTTTVLAEVPSGIPDPWTWGTLKLSAMGSGPVTLTASVDGRAMVSATDSSSQALTGPGQAGLFTQIAGVDFDDFELDGIGTGSGGGSGGGETPDAGTPSGSLSLSVDYTDTAHDFLTVDSSGTAYATSLSDPETLLASTDGRSWSARGQLPSSGDFYMMTALSDGTLIADVISGGTHHLARSSDHGATWARVLDLGNYGTLTPHSFAELDGTVYMLEYQSFTEGATTIRLWASTDDGQSWTVRHTFTTHRHGHGLLADPTRHALWAFFGDTDAQCGIYRSTDAGQTFTLLLPDQPGDIVDATLLDDGSILFGQDISYQPGVPHVATLDPSGNYDEGIALTGPSYGIHAISGGGFVVSAARESSGDIYPPGEVSAHVYVSPDGTSWKDVLDYPRASDQYTVRADVYWELPNGELVLWLYDAQGFGLNGEGYELLGVHR